ncbi:hypothetical protein JOQ06_023697, partial [Pogonophryne albipinna]
MLLSPTPRYCQSMPEQELPHPFVNQACSQLTEIVEDVGEKDTDRKKRDNRDSFNSF